MWGGGFLRYAPSEKFWNFSPQKCFFHYSEGLLVCCYKFLLKSATSVIKKCDRYYKGRQFYYKVRQNTVVLSDSCCRFRSSTVCSCTHSNREGWLMRLIDFSRFLINAALLSDVFRQCWSFSSTKFSCEISHPFRTVYQNLWFSLFRCIIYIICLSMRSKILGGTFIIYVSNLWMFFL